MTSLAFKTDLFFVEEVAYHPGLTVALSASNPTYYWGNYLLYETQPTPEEARREFERYFPDAKHCSVGWQEDVPPLASWKSLGFLEVDDLVLVCESANPSDNYHLLSLDCWGDVRNLSAQVDPQEKGNADYKLFKDRLFKRYEQLVTEGKGQWFGLWEGGKLISHCGAFWENGVARFQCVETHQEFRRRGHCHKLTSAALSYLFCVRNIDEAIIVAAKDSVASRIYERCGFVKTGVQRGVWLAP